MKMNYFVFGTNDMTAAVAFYDALFEGTGVSRIHSEGRMTLWSGEDFMFGVAEPFDGKAATNGNGTMAGFNMDSSAEVEKLHQRAVELGGSSDGEPGLRSGRFAAYIRDPDRNKICLFE